MKLILLRHASREHGPSGNPGLNARGKMEAVTLIEQLQPHLPNSLADLALLTSPKRRAIETLAPLSQALSIVPEIQQNLDERMLDENGSAFAKRITHLLKQIETTQKSVTILCTHADWLEEVCLLLNCEFRGFACAEFRTFSRQNAIWHLKK
jgi:broad specificity phosphatase PhoE